MKVIRYKQQQLYIRTIKILDTNNTLTCYTNDVKRKWIRFELVSFVRSFLININIAVETPIL